MSEKIYKVLKQIYSIMMFAAFFGGVLPLIPFVFAIIIGGSVSEAIALFLYNQYYPCVFALASISILVGLTAMYVGKKQSHAAKG